MERDDWLGVWERGDIRFHRPDPNPLMVAHLPGLGLAPGARLFLPLCGKSVDIGWLRAQGFRVAGAELSRLAVEQLFDSLGETPDIAEAGALRRFSARDLTIHQGDIFDLSAAQLGPVDAVYDRAALIALPGALRPRYAAHLAALTGGAPQLLLTITRPDDRGQGPPYSVGEAEVRRLYGETHAIRPVATGDSAHWPFREEVWLLGGRPEPG